ncbi:MAG: hypothetical protein GTN89_12520 [Acidobacteria bacterium]|nr:hypothetical protein [Acidobacteriota bacterium]NIM60362.1 hypothetical protein [Acidobacteriota bacterium]NIO60098.1 hypothetical protein [Acidobacteriota bacterium]NIQ31165.1 hypothetical protein [Acidobacteriota bacterium]NIQ86298.1 hypothetical protein [Acidobacteriota bacterium]
MELSDRNKLFIGLKLDTGLRRQLEAVSGPDRKYVSGEDPAFLRIVSLGDDLYVGKVVEDRLTTDRVDDVRRNVVSILHRLCPDTRIPETLEIVACLAEPGHGP